MVGDRLLAWASEGIRVIINYNGSVEQAEQVQRQIREAGGQAEIYQCNVADFASCETFVSDVLKTWDSSIFCQ